MNSPPFVFVVAIFFWCLVVSNEYLGVSNEYLIIFTFLELIVHFFAIHQASLNKGRIDTSSINLSLLDKINCVLKFERRSFSFAYPKNCLNSPFVFLSSTFSNI